MWSLSSLFRSAVTPGFLWALTTAPIIFRAPLRTSQPNTRLGLKPRHAVVFCAVYATGVSSASSVHLPLESTQHILNRSRQINNGREPIQSEDEWLWIVSVGFFQATGGLDLGVRNQQPYLLLVINSRWLSFTTCSGDYSLHVFERNAIWDRFITRVSEVNQDDSRVHIPKITFWV